MSLMPFREADTDRPMLESERLGLAAHLHVAMRRKLGRVTDVEWLVRDAAYAREILRLALASEHAEVQACARKLAQALAPLLQRPVPAPPSAQAPQALVARAALEQRYIGRLR